MRHHLLRIMLGCLAVAAAVGAVAILTNGSTVMWRVSGTTIVTAVAAALMMPLMMLVDKPASRAAGQLGVAALIATFVLAHAMIWEIPRAVIGFGGEEQFGMTMVFIFCCALPGMLLLRLRHHAYGRLAGRVGIYIAAATFALLMLGTWVNFGASGFMQFEEHFLASGGALAGLGTLFTICIMAFDVPRFGARRRLGQAVQCVGMLAALCSFGIAIHAILNHIGGESATMICLITTAALIGHANICTLVPLRDGQGWLRTGTILMAVICALGVDYLAILNAPGDPIMQVAGAAGFVAACGTLALLILARVNRRLVSGPRVYEAAREITLTCPGCDRKQTLPVGTSNCPICRLRFSITVEEPRCEQCDYLLFMLTSDRCPECGKPIGAADAGPLQLPVGT